MTRITVTELRDNTFYASITIQQNGTEIEVDSRPSDAIALAVRAEAPIYRRRPRDRGVGDRVRGRRGERGGDRGRVPQVPRPGHPRRVRGRGRGDRRRTSRSRDDLALREVEDRREELAQPSAESGPRFARVRSSSIDSLALGVEEADPARLLVGLDLRDELQPRVDRVDDRAVGVARSARGTGGGRGRRRALMAALPLYVNALRASPGS